MRILIVEDDARISSFIKRGLEGEELLVDCVVSKPEAMKALTSKNYDAIILDVFLGPDCGLDLCQDLRTQQNTIPVLIMSATGSPDMKRRSFLAGADEFLPKPFAFEDLVCKLQTAIRMVSDTAVRSA